MYAIISLQRQLLVIWGYTCYEKNNNDNVFVMIIEISNEDINGYIKKHFGVNIHISNTTKNRVRLTYDGGAPLHNIPLDVDIKYHSKVQMELTPYCALPGIETIISGALDFLCFRKVFPLGVVRNGNSITIALNQIPQFSSLLSNVIVNAIEFNSSGLVVDIRFR